MRIWRISNHADLSGVGGSYSAGRWNHLGTRIVYCADHPALAMLEVLVHVDPEDLPERFQLLEIDVPDGMSVEAVELPGNWGDDIAISRDAFEAFCDRGATPLLSVPSIVMPRCSNVLINPLHPDHGMLTVASAESHPLDPRFLT